MQPGFTTATTWPVLATYEKTGSSSISQASNKLAGHIKRIIYIYLTFNLLLFPFGLVHLKRQGFEGFVTFYTYVTKLSKI